MIHVVKKWNHPGPLYQPIYGVVINPGLPFRYTLPFWLGYIKHYQNSYWEKLVFIIHVVSEMNCAKDQVVSKDII